MSIGTYAQLRAAIANWTVRPDLADGGANASRTPEFVVNAEARMNRDLARIGAGELGATTALTTSAEAIDLPADFNGFRYLGITGNEVTELVYRPPEVLYREYPSASARQPRAYTLHGKDGASDVLQARFRPIPDGVYTLVGYYYKKLTTLIGNDANHNWMLDNNPDAYLYSSCLEAAIWMGDEAQINRWATGYQKALDDIKALDDARRIGGSSPRSAPGIRMIRGM